MRRETKGWRNELQLRRGVKQLLRTLQLDPPLDVGALCERLAQQRNRPISLVPYPLPVPGVFGLWISTADADYILYQKDTTMAHQEHIILHEVGHIVSNHDKEENDNIWDHLFPDIPPEMVRRVLQREGYVPSCEREAEMVATVIKEWATLLDRLRFTPARKTDAARRLRGAFDDHQAWL